MATRVSRGVRLFDARLQLGDVIGYVDDIDERVESVECDPSRNGREDGNLATESRKVDDHARVISCVNVKRRGKNRRHACGFVDCFDPDQHALRRAGEPELARLERRRRLTPTVDDRQDVSCDLRVPQARCQVRAEIQPASPDPAQVDPTQEALAEMTIDLFSKHGIEVTLRVGKEIDVQRMSGSLFHHSELYVSSSVDVR